MKFTNPLLKGSLIQRYKRFLADIILENHSDYTFENNADIFTIKGLSSIILKTKVGKRKIEDHLNFKVLNGIIAPKEYLKIKLATGI